MVQQVIFLVLFRIYSYTRKQQLCLSHKYYFFHFTDINLQHCSATSTYYLRDFIFLLKVFLLLIFYSIFASMARINSSFGSSYGVDSIYERSAWKENYIFCQFGYRFQNRLNFSPYHTWSVFHTIPCLGCGCIKLHK